MTYSIGIGPSVDQEELKEIAGDVSRVYHVETYDDIQELRQRLGIDLSKCYDPNGEIDLAVVLLFIEQTIETWMGLVKLPR